MAQLQKFDPMEAKMKPDRLHIDLHPQLCLEQLILGLEAIQRINGFLLLSRSN